MRGVREVRLGRKQRQIVVVSGIVLVALIVGALATTIGVFDQSFQATVYDNIVKVAPTPPKNQVTVIGMDDATIAKYGRWPLPRRAYADALRALREVKPRVIGFDVGFFEPSDRPQDDALFAQEIKAAGNVILAMQGEGAQTVRDQALRYDSLKLPIAPFREAAAGLAAVNILPELDGRVRRANLVVTDGRDRYYALPLVLAAKQLLADPSGIRVEASRVVLTAQGRERAIPVDPGGEMRIYFTALPATSLTEQHKQGLRPCSLANELCVVSMADVIDGKVPAELLRTRIVFFGAHSASALPDDYPVPNSDQSKMFGVEIWANASLAILSHRYPTLKQDLPTTLSWLTLVTVIGVALIVRFRLAGFFAALGVLVLYGIIQIGLFALGIQGTGVTQAPSIAYVAAGAPFWWVVVLGYLLVEEQRSVRQTQRAFGLAVTPQIAKVILELQEKGALALGGQLREATILFGDIRGFTTMSEGMGPAELMATLNRYFDGMVTVVQKYGGTVNKYNGDNIMVLWGVPIETPDHARQAVECALELQRWIVSERAKGGPDVSFGFGINSGQVIAGFLGAQGRFEYTVIGDTANVASRLTSGDIARRDQVAVSEATLAALGDDAEATDLGQVQVKGRVEPVHCFQVNRVGAILSPNPAPPPAEPIRAAAVAGYH